MICTWLRSLVTSPQTAEMPLDSASFPERDAAANIIFFFTLLVSRMAETTKETHRRTHRDVSEGTLWRHRQYSGIEPGDAEDHRPG